MKRLEESDLSKPPSKVLEIICKLGKGSYGSVFKAKYKSSGDIVAVKKVPVDSDLSEIVKEISIMQQCDSPYIVKCYGSLFDNQDLWICMEYCGAGSVADIMRLRNKTLNEVEIGTVLKYSLLGLDYLHQMRKIHRDIKAGNILLTNTGMAKLADFGVAGQLADTLAKRNTVIGTPFWMAPEVIQEVGYNCSADIWSLGITAIEMGDGKPPLGGEHPMRALFMIPSQPSPRLRSETSWSSEFVAFVNACLARAPDARPTAADLLATKFIRSAKPHSTLCPLIEESNRLREKRLIDSKSALGVVSPSTTTGRSTQPQLDPVDVFEEPGSSGTMVQCSRSSSVIVKEDAAGSERNATITSLDRGGKAESPLDQVGTMIVNDTERESTGLEQTDHVDLLTENFETLTHDLSRPTVSEGRSSTEPASHEDVANAVAAAQRDCGVINSPQICPSSNPPPPPEGQRHFVPLSRAFQEGCALIDGHTSQNPLSSANEPGGLSRLSYSELEQQLVNLSRDLETELRNLAIRYRHKRQPLLDAIAEKAAALAP